MQNVIIPRFQFLVKTIYPIILQIPPYPGMKRIAFFLLFGLPWGLSAQSSSKVALVVAISHYAPETDWAPTNAANNVPLIVNSLLEQGYERENIKVLEDAEATKAGIKNAIRKNLIDKATNGGSAVLYLSGYEQQVQDDNGDESDGLDEAFVPYNSPREYKPGVYEGDSLLRDDELYQLVAPLKKKLGLSGSFLLGSEPINMGSNMRAEKEPATAIVIMAAAEFMAKLNPPSQGALPESFDLTSGNDDGEADIAELHAATVGNAAEIMGDDGKSVGAFTYALSKTLAEAAPDATYSDLMNGIRTVLSAQSPGQMPGLQGHADRKVLGGLRRHSRKFATTELYAQKKLAQLDGGLLQGLLPGSEMVFYPAACNDTAGLHPLAAGVVVQADLYTALVKLKEETKKGKLVGSLAWYRRRSLGGLRVTLSLSTAEKTLDTEIRNLCQAMPFVFLQQTNGDLQISSPKPGILCLQTSRGDSLYQDSAFLALTGPLQDKIREYAQAQYFRELSLQEPSMQTTLELIPITMVQERGKWVEKSRFPLATRTDAMGNIRFQPGDAFKVKITNYGQRPVYFKMLYIQPNNQLNVWPSAHQSDGALLMPGESRECQQKFQIPPQDGACVLKLIATESPLNLNEIMAAKGKLLRGENGQSMNQMEQFFAATFENLATLPNLPPGSAHISTVIFYREKPGK